MLLNDKTLLKGGSYINGQWCRSPLTFDIENPAKCEIIASVYEVTDQQLEEAIQSAYLAQKDWAAKTAKQRAHVLLNWFELIHKNIQDLAIIMTLEQGKPLRESFSEISNAASYIQWFAEQGKRIYGDVVAGVEKDRRQIVLLEPVGVVSAITPWNFPTGMIVRKAAPALAAGCSFIVKPSELTPLSALALAELAARAGIPSGVFNVVTGTDAQKIGESLTEHPLIRKFTFTGSTTVGKKLLAQCASTVKKTSLELGGNAPLIVFDDADLEKAVSGTMLSKFRNSGQTCVSANRIIVQSGIYDRFVQRMSEEMSQLHLAEGFAQVVDMGPLINSQAIKRLDGLVKAAITEGATVLLGGHTVDTLGERFYAPTLLTNVTMNMRVAKEEIFGPIASLLKFETEQQAIEIANDTHYGLASYFFSNDLGRSWRLSETLEYGMVGVNVGVLTSVQAPFGGVKESGLGREGSQYGLDDFLEKKYICMGNL